MENDVFSVSLYSKDEDNVRPNGSRYRPLNLVAIDKATRMIEVKYGGAHTGRYSFTISSSQQGDVSTAGKTFNSVFEFTDFQPTSGSKYGGQLVTITGSHFSTNAMENPVKIGYEYISGVIHYCDIIESLDTQIKCRMRLDPERKAGEQELIVFASTYEEAECKAD